MVSINSVTVSYTLHVGVHMIRLQNHLYQINKLHRSYNTRYTTLWFQITFMLYILANTTVKSDALARSSNSLEEIASQSAFDKHPWIICDLISTSVSSNSKVIASCCKEMKRVNSLALSTHTQARTHTHAHAQTQHNTHYILCFLFRSAQVFK